MEIRRGENNSRSKTYTKTIVYHKQARRCEQLTYRIKHLAKTKTEDNQQKSDKLNQEAAMNIIQNVDERMLMNRRLLEE